MIARALRLLLLGLLVGGLAAPAGAKSQHPAAAPARTAPVVLGIKSPGGVLAYYSEDHTAPVIAVSFEFRGGAALDPASRQGLSNLGASLMDEGAGDLDSLAFHAALEDTASTFHMSADRDRIRGELKTTTPHLADVVKLARLALLQPRFDPDAITRVRREIEVQLASDAEVPSHLAERELYRDLFGSHSYARDENGTPEGLAAITRADLEAWAKERLTQDRLLVGVAGDITAAQVGPLLDALFADLPAKSPAPMQPPAATVSTTPRIDRVPRDLPQSEIAIGAPGIARSDADWYAAEIDDYIFGGGSFASRLMNEVREKRGLAYSVRSALVSHDAAAIMMVRAGTRADEAEQSLAVIRAQWAEMRDPGPTPDEISGAKQYLTGAWPLKFTSTERIAALLVDIQHDNLGLDYFARHNSLIDAVTPDNARRVAQRLYDPSTLTVVVVGRLPGSGDQPAPQ